MQKQKIEIIMGKLCPEEKRHETKIQKCTPLRTQICMLLQFVQAKLHQVAKEK